MVFPLSSAPRGPWAGADKAEELGEFWYLMYQLKAIKILRRES